MYLQINIYNKKKYNTKIENKAKKQLLKLRFILNV